MVLDPVLWPNSLTLVSLTTKSPKFKELYHIISICVCGIPYITCSFSLGSTIFESVLLSVRLELSLFLCVNVSPPRSRLTTRRLTPSVSVRRSEGSKQLVQ